LAQGALKTGGGFKADSMLVIEECACAAILKDIGLVQKILLVLL